MATATTSKLNSKLPSVSKIAWCTAAGTKMATKIWTGESGKFTMKVGFKQNAKTYPYQIQWRQRSRYTTANARIKGAQWTAWGEWKAACTGGGITFNWTESDHPVNRWMKANKGINKNGTYITFINFNEYQIPAAYDLREFQFRIRTFNKSQARHGNWCTQTLQALKRAEVRDETYITAADGGVKVKFNYKWDREGTKSWIKSIVDSSGRELLSKSYNGKIEVGYLTQNTTPTPREGYAGGMIKIPLSRLKRKIVAGEQLTTEIYFETAEGVRTRLTSGQVINPTRDVPMTLTTTWHEDRGLLAVSATNAGTVDLTAIEASATYVYNGKTYSIPATKSTVRLQGTSTFYFLPPIGIESTIEVREEDAEDYKDTETITYTPRAAGIRLNKADNVDTCGVAWGNPSWELATTPKMETALPHGRGKSVAFYGVGSTTELSMAATIVDKAGMYGGDYSRKRAWDKIRDNQGIYYFRTSTGEFFKVALSSVNLSHEAKDLYELTASMIEVV